MSKYATSSVIADISNQLKTLEHETTMNRFSGARVSHDLSLLSYFITFYLWFLLLQQISGVFENKKKTYTFLAIWTSCFVFTCTSKDVPVKVTYYPKISSSNDFYFLCVASEIN